MSKVPTPEQIELADEIFLSLKIPQPMPMDKKSCRKYIGKYAPLYFQKLRPALKEYKDLRTYIDNNCKKLVEKESKSPSAPASHNPKPLTESRFLGKWCHKDFRQKVIDFYHNEGRGTILRTAKHFKASENTIRKVLHKENIPQLRTVHRTPMDKLKDIAAYYWSNPGTSKLGLTHVFSVNRGVVYKALKTFPTKDSLDKDVVS